MWTGGKSRGGERYSEQAFYGTFNPGGEVTGGVRAHVYIAWVHGLIPSLKVPEGMNLDHRCHRALCCNPFHLELVEAGLNQQRRIDRAKEQKRAEWVEAAFVLAMSQIGYRLILSVPAGEDAPCPF